MVLKSVIRFACLEFHMGSTYSSNFDLDDAVFLAHRGNRSESTVLSWLIVFGQNDLEASHFLSIQHSRRLILQQSFWMLQEIVRVSWEGGTGSVSSQILPRHV